MKNRLNIFFDDGGVMNNNYIRGEQWKPLIAEYFVERYGGDPNKWMEANYFVVSKIMKRIYEYEKNGNHVTYLEFKESEIQTWIEGMFSFIGLPFPPKGQYSLISREVETIIPPKTNAAYPGIIEVIKKLYEDGNSLYTASGEESWLLKGYTKGMGVNHCFKVFYGPDLVNEMKIGKEFYEAIFAHSKINPEKTALIDDKPHILKIAKDLGIFVIQACITGEYKPEFEFSYKNPQELYKIIQEIKKNQI